MGRMRDRFALVMLCVVVAATAFAMPISERKARDIAKSFMTNQRISHTALRMVSHAPRLTSSSQDAAYYVFNASDHGYVIVAGDDRAPAVLAYSDQGTFDPDNLPEAMQEMLDGYASQIALLAQGAKVAPQPRAAGAIAPLIKSAWSQNNPYNILFPYVKSGNTSSHARVGCVATAASQVLNYWQYPSSTTQPIPAYVTSTKGIEMPELPVTTFKWDIIQNTYLTTDTLSEAALEASKLCLYVAQSVEMDFKESSSGATTGRLPLRLATYFGFDPSAHFVSRQNYSTQEWADALYGEIAAGRPVIYSGSKKSGGHAFICDGYDGNGMFHINWGWNGMSNGYFLLNVLNPDEQGTGSADGPYGYIYSQAACLGLQPDQGGSSEFGMTAVEMTLDSSIESRANVGDPFVATVSGRFYNYTSSMLAIRFGWGLFEGDQLIESLYTTYTDKSTPGNYFNLKDKVLKLGENMTEGTYRIMPMYSEYDNINWRPCIGADRNYIEVTIDGNQCHFVGYGTTGQRDYSINDITMEGTMHNGRPINIDLNMTNNGKSSNELLYMYVDGVFFGTAFVGLEPGETGDITYMYMSDVAGDHTFTWSWNDDGSDPIATRTITLEPMPAASLSATFTILNVTDADNKIITSDKFSIDLTVTNNGTTTYDEDISAKLFKHTKGNSGTNVQGINQHVTLEPGETKTIRFDMTNVLDGWKYFIKTYYYSEGNQIALKNAGTATFTIVFPDEPDPDQNIAGDVNSDGEVNINDVTILIDYLLNPDDAHIDRIAADVNTDGEINISDVTGIIDILLSR